MRWSRWFAAAALAFVFAFPAEAQPDGTTLRPHTIEHFTGTRATSLADYNGRLVLLELFAHW